MSSDQKPIWTIFDQILGAGNQGIDSVMCDVQPRWFNQPASGNPVRFELTKDGLIELLFGVKNSDCWDLEVKLFKNLKLQFSQKQPSCLFQKEKDCLSLTFWNRYLLTEQDGEEVQTSDRKQAAFYSLNEHAD